MCVGFVIGVSSKCGLGRGLCVVNESFWCGGCSCYWRWFVYICVVGCGCEIFFCVVDWDERFCYLCLWL